MPARLFDRESNQWVLVPDEEVTASVASGKFGFETGLRIPVVSGDGTLGDLTSDEAERAFREGGFRWQTKADMRAWEEEGRAQILQEHMGGVGDMAAAGAAGFLRKYSGVSDAAIAGAGALASELGIGGKNVSYQDGIDALNMLREANPGSSLAGEIVGSVASPINRMIPGQGTIGPAKPFMAGAGKAAELVNRVAPKAVGSAVEGMTMGFVDGVSEAILGPPDEVAENIAASTGAGLVFGGLFGAAAGALPMGAAQVKAGFKSILNTADEWTQGAMRKGTEKTVRVALSAAQEKEFADIAGEFAQSPELRQLAFEEGGLAKVKEIIDELRPAVGEARKQFAREKEEFIGTLKGKATATRATLKEDVEKHGGNLRAMMDEKAETIASLNRSLDDRLLVDNTVSDTSALAGKEIERLQKSLQATGDEHAKQLSREISSLVNAQRSVHGLGPKDDLTLFAGREVQLLRDVRDTIADRITKMKPAGREAAEKMDENVAYLLKEHPTYGADLAELNKLEDAYGAVRDFVGKKNVGRGAIFDRIANDPLFAKQFDEVLQRFGTFAPDFQALREAGTDVAARRAALDTLEANVKKVVGGKKYLTSDDLEAVAKELGDVDLVAKAGKLRDLTASMVGEDVTPVTRYIQIQKALGKDVAEDLATLLPHEGPMAKLAAAMEGKVGKDLDNAALTDLIMQRFGKKMTRAAVGSVVGGILGGATGDFAGGAVGSVVGMMAAGGSARALSMRALKALTALERQSNAAYQKIDKAVVRAVDGLTTNNRGRKLVTSAAINGSSVEERRKSYSRQLEHLVAMQDPAKRIDDFEARVGGHPDAPRITQALSTQHSKSLDFLYGKAPKDPFAGQSLLHGKSPWTPSDFELSKFNRYVEAAENPMHALDRVATGTVTPEEVETIKTLYPQMYNRLQGQVMDAIIKPSTNLSYSQRISLGTLFDVPVDVTLQPGFVQAMQAIHAQTVQGGGEVQAQTAKPVARPGSFKMNTDAMASPVSRVSEKK